MKLVSYYYRFASLVNYSYRKISVDSDSASILGPFLSGGRAERCPTSWNQVASKSRPIKVGSPT